MDNKGKVDTSRYILLQGNKRYICTTAKNKIQTNKVSGARNHFSWCKQVRSDWVSFTEGSVWEARNYSTVHCNPVERSTLEGNSNWITVLNPFIVSYTCRYVKFYNSGPQTHCWFCRTRQLEPDFVLLAAASGFSRMKFSFYISHSASTSKEKKTVFPIFKTFYWS